MHAYCTLRLDKRQQRVAHSGYCGHQCRFRASVCNIDIWCNEQHTRHSSPTLVVVALSSGSVCIEQLFNASYNIYTSVHHISESHSFVPLISHRHSQLYTAGAACLRLFVACYAIASTLSCCRHIVRKSHSRAHAHHQNNRADTSAAPTAHQTDKL
jgi:hypothetical protein